MKGSGPQVSLKLLLRIDFAIKDLERITCQTEENSHFLLSVFDTFLIVSMSKYILTLSNYKPIVLVLAMDY